jgi:hypothetical protein
MQTRTTLAGSGKADDRRGGTAIVATTPTA